MITVSNGRNLIVYYNAWERYSLHIIRNHFGIWITCPIFYDNHSGIHPDSLVNIHTSNSERRPWLYLYTFSIDTQLTSISACFSFWISHFSFNVSVVVLLKQWFVLLSSFNYWVLLPLLMALFSSFYLSFKSIIFFISFFLSLKSMILFLFF